MTQADLQIGPMTSNEALTLDAWAAAEGWNPGLADIDIAWACDPEAFIALRRGEELIGGGTIFVHGGTFGFMGLFILKPEWRGTGLGGRLWHERLRLLRARLPAGASIGMDGVFEMAPFYAKGGFALAHRDLRFEGMAPADADDASVRPLAETAFAQVEDFDRRYFPAARAEFLRRWMTAPGVQALGLREDGRLRGYGVMRPALTGFKIGPLFAEDEGTATRILGSLLARAGGAQVQLDVPAPNENALRLAERYGLREVFGCARMYHGPAPALPLTQIYGVTSFEFG